MEKDPSPVDPAPSLSVKEPGSRKPVDRITQIIKVYHEHRGDQPHVVEAIAWNLLSSEDEESWSKRVKVGPNWISLPLGWLDPEKVGLIVVDNQSGKNLLIQPTQEERALLNRKIVEVGHPDNKVNTLVQAGWAQPLYPTDVNNLFIRCLAEESECRIHVFPK